MKTIPNAPKNWEKIRRGLTNRRGKNIIHNGIKFRSTLEIFAYELLMENNIIFDYEVKVELMKKFKYDNEAIRAITYSPDFSGTSFVIETKGVRFPTFDIKWKLFKHLLYKNNIDIKLYMPRNQRQVIEVIKEIKSKIESGEFINGNSILNGLT